MTEAFFPILGALLAFAVLLPGSALLAKASSLLLDRYEDAGLHASGTLRYALLVGSSAVPLAWLVSAGLHQAVSLRSSTAKV